VNQTTALRHALIPELLRVALQKRSNSNERWLGFFGSERVTTRQPGVVAAHDERIAHVRIPARVLRASAGAVLCAALWSCAAVPDTPPPHPERLPEMPLYMPIRPRTELRQDLSGTVSWIGTKWDTEPGHAVERCVDGSIDLNSWNPLAGTLQRRPTGLTGDVQFELVTDHATWFTFEKDPLALCAPTRFFVAQHTGRSTLSLERPAAELGPMERWAALSDDAVVVLAREAAARFPRGILVRRDGGHLVARDLPALPIAYGDDTAWVALDDHRVMLVGGSDGERPPCVSCRATTQVLDVTTGRWSAGPALLEGRSKATAVRLPDGSVLVAGGYSAKVGVGDGGTRSVERWTPRTGTFEPMPALPVGEVGASASWMPGREGRTLLLAEGLSTAVSACDLSTGAWYLAGVTPDEYEPGQLLPFLRDGQAWAWQMMDVIGRWPRHVFRLVPPPEPRGARAASSGPATTRDITPPDLDHRFVAQSRFVEADVTHPALLLGPELFEDQQHFLPAAVTAVDASGRAIPLPSLNHGRREPDVLRIGGGLLVTGGDNHSAYRLESPPLPPEWLPSTADGLRGRWRDLRDTGLRPGVFTAPSRDGGVIEIAQDGEVVRARLQPGAAPDTLAWVRRPWAHLKLPRRSTADSPMVVRELADGRLIVAGGEVQSDRLPPDDRETAALPASAASSPSATSEPSSTASTQEPVNDANAGSNGAPDASPDAAPQDADARDTWYSEDRFEVVDHAGGTVLSPPSRPEWGTTIVLDDGRVVKRYPPDETGRTVLEAFDPVAGRWRELPALPAELRTDRTWRLQGSGHALLLVGATPLGTHPDQPIQAIWLLDDAHASLALAWSEADHGAGADAETRQRPGLVVVGVPDGGRVLVPLLP